MQFTLALLFATVSAGGYGYTQGYGQDYGYGRPETYTTMGMRQDYLYPQRQVLAWDNYKAPSSTKRDAKLWEREQGDWSRPQYDGMNEYDKEDYDVDVWGQILVGYDLDDDRDQLEGDMSLIMDSWRAEMDDWWESYRTIAEKKEYKNEEVDCGYGMYTRIDVRETILRANQLWNADVLAARAHWRTTLKNGRAAHLAETEAIVAKYDAQVEKVRARLIALRTEKRAATTKILGELRAEVEALIAASHAQVAEINAKHNELVLELNEAVDMYGAEADIKLILTKASEGGLDLYGEKQVRALIREDVDGTYYGTYPSAVYGASGKYGETVVGQGYGATGYYEQPGYGYGY